MKFKSIALSPLGLIPAALLPAEAADLRVPTKAPPAVTTYVPSWTGWYIGVNAGVIGDQSKEGAFAPGVSGFSSNCWIGDCTFSNTQRSTGVLAGVQVGYNFQSGKWVYGAEVDIGLSSAKKNSTQTQNFYIWSASTGVDALGTARLRLGYAFDRALVYATGGLAFGDMRNSFQQNPSYTWSGSAGWQVGWTLGGGLEYMFNPNWTLKGEALYYDLGKENHVSLDLNLSDAYGLSDRMRGWIGRIGINYLFR